MSPIGRRRVLAWGLAAGAAFNAMPLVHAMAASPAPRSLAFLNTHTGEHVRCEYWCNGDYVADALREVDHVLRDHRSGDVAAIDPRLLDLLHAVRLRLDAPAAFEVISGYRSPTTNAALAAQGRGVATHSLHTQGKAIDIRLPGCDLTALRAAALGLSGGGVGYYPRSNFVHMDTGRVRTW